MICTSSTTATTTTTTTTYEYYVYWCIAIVAKRLVLVVLVLRYTTTSKSYWVLSIITRMVARVLGGITGLQQRQPLLLVPQLPGGTTTP